MIRLGFLKLASVALLALSATGCCCLGQPGSTTTDGVEGPTLRAGFVRVSKGAKTLAYYSTDKNNTAVEYWMVEAGDMPVFAKYPDVLKYTFLNKSLATQPQDMCQPALMSSFADPQVYRVTSTMSAPYGCPPGQ